MATEKQPPDDSLLTPNNESVPAAHPTGECLRCHQTRPLVEDGFCEDCLKKMEDACL